LFFYTHSKPKTISNADCAALESCSATPLVETSPGTVGTSPGEVVLADSGGGGCGPGTVGMSPANAEVDTTQVRTIVIKKRLMFVSPLS